MMPGIVFFVLECWYLMLPGMLANMAPPLVKRVHFLDYPVDFGMKLRGRPILGSHKTFRGLFFGILVAVIIVFFQGLLFQGSVFFQGFSLFDYSQHNFVVVGLLMGFGPLFGDAVKSFFKRQAGVGPGRPWIPFDQVDFVLGWLLFTAIVYVPPWQVALTLLLTVPLLHIATNHIGYYMGVNKSKW
jgi:CDP-2,3-bis-(O-geranylgeranyl)-sn-glycerol synthase